MKMYMWAWGERVASAPVSVEALEGALPVLAASDGPCFLWSRNLCEAVTVL